MIIYNLIRAKEYPLVSQKYYSYMNQFHKISLNLTFVLEFSNDLYCEIISGIEPNIIIFIQGIYYNYNKCQLNSCEIEGNNLILSVDAEWVIFTQSLPSLFLTEVRNRLISDIIK